jgi:hypothetical protein
VAACAPPARNLGGSNDPVEDDGAAEAIFNHAAKAIKIEDMDACLSALEVVNADRDRRR